MNEITLIASITPKNSRNIIKKLNKIKKYIEEDHNVRLNLIITNGGNADVIFIDDEVIYIDDGTKVSDIVDKIMDRLVSSKSWMFNDKVAAGIVNNL